MVKPWEPSKMIDRQKFAAGLFALISAFISATAFGQAGPPMIGDDPGTPGNGKWEINIAYTGVQTEHVTAMDLGYLDINYGLGDNIQVNYQGGVLAGKQNGQGYQYGWDDSLVGFKWRFLDQEKNGIDMSVFPQVGFNTTSSFAHNGIVESGASCFLPFEIAATFGKWELDGELGYQYYEHDRNQWAGGPVIGYLLNDRVELIGEARMICDKDFRSNNLILDAGTRISLIEDHLQLLLDAGRGLRNGDDSPHLYFYAGFGIRF
jgi:hypothetical protein